MFIGIPGGGVLNTPSITLPSNGATSQNTNLTLTSSTWASLNNDGSHASSDWEISTNNTFTNIVASSYSSTTNKTSFTPSLSYSTTYYARVRYRNAEGMVSPWSTPVSFTTKSAGSMTVSGGGSAYAGYSVTFDITANTSDSNFGAYNMTAYINGSPILLSSPVGDSGLPGGEVYWQIANSNTLYLGFVGSGIFNVYFRTPGGVNSNTLTVTVTVEPWG